MPGKAGKSGGARAGAGRKAKPIAPLNVPAEDDPLEFLLGVMKDEGADPSLRVRSAIAAAQYVHLKKGDGGIKDGRKDAAKAAASGKFGAPAAPRMVVNNN